MEIVFELHKTIRTKTCLVEKGKPLGVFKDDPQMKTVPFELVVGT